MTPRATKYSTGRAYGYARVSSDEQARSGLGIEAQRTTIRQFAERAQLAVVQIFEDEGVSGSLPPERRPGMSAMLAALKRGDTVITARRDRLHRHRKVAVDVDLAIAGKRAALVVVDAPSTGDEATDEMRAGFDDLIAIAYRTRVRKATREALTAKRARGERFSGQAPYGFRFTPGPPTKMEPEPTEQVVLEVMRECRDATFSYEATARELNRLGHRTRSGQSWRWQYVQSTLARSARMDSAG